MRLGSRLRSPRLLAAVSVGSVMALTACGGGGPAGAGPTTTGVSPVRLLGKDPVPTETTQALNLPAVGAAANAACDSDFKSLRAAEGTYQLVNGSFVSIRELVAQQYLRTPSAYYVDVKIGTPPGGYTLVAAPDGPCASLPVSGSQ